MPPLSRLLVLFAVAFLAVIVSSNTAASKAFIPLSANSYSFVRRTPFPVVVELYIDLACSDTKNVWADLKAIVSEFEKDVLLPVSCIPVALSLASILGEQGSASSELLQWSGRRFHLYGYLF
jgi:hypothetical protein